ncbi:MAG: class I SAM-dependent methyltransferase [Thermodesulfobacteriota bacterium]|nr:class I SAM-dependent methyltransferase [Thermodesulfobacteriota bacterium]
MATFSGMRKSLKNGLPGQTMDMSFTSRALPVFIAKMNSHSMAQVLDLGPVCNENINIFAHRIKKLYICDMFSHLARALEKGAGSKQWWRQLNYPSGTFDGILLWDLPDRLADGDTNKAGRRCYDMLKPGGMVVVCAATETKKNTEVNAFVLQKDFRVALRAQPHLNLPLHARKTGDLIGVLDPLKSVQSFLFRNGLREFIFCKNKK